MTKDKNHTTDQRDQTRQQKYRTTSRLTLLKKSRQYTESVIRVSLDHSGEKINTYVHSKYRYDMVGGYIMVFVKPTTTF